MMPAFPFAARARSPELAARLVAALPRRPRLVQLGADGGAMLRWLAPRIGRALVWEFVDEDAEAIATTYQLCAEAAEQRGLTVTWPGRALLIHVPGGAWRIEGSVGDLNVPSELDLARVDAMLCEGLLPAASGDWMDELVECWDGALLATLNATDRVSLLPPHRDDRLVTRALAGRRAVLDPLGVPLGGRAAASLAARLRARRGEVTLARSDCRVRGDLLVLRDWIIEAAQNAALAMPPMRGRVAAWQAQRVAQALRGRLQLRVDHQDLLYLPR